MTIHKVYDDYRYRFIQYAWQKSNANTTDYCRNLFISKSYTEEEIQVFLDSTFFDKSIKDTKARFIMRCYAELYFGGAYIHSLEEMKKHDFRFLELDDEGQLLLEKHIKRRDY